MKKPFFLLLLFAFVFSFSAKAQMQEWTWDDYRTKFKVPTSFKVLTNTETSFSAGNRTMNLTIYPRTGENLAYNKMASSLSRWARENNITYDGSPNYMESLNGYWGCYIDGYSGSAPVSLLLLVDPDYPDVSMYIWLSYTSADYDTAVNILKSFTPN